MCISSHAGITKERPDDPKSKGGGTSKGCTQKGILKSGMKPLWNEILIDKIMEDKLTERIDTCLAMTTPL